jgi:hypothetical protein
MKRVTVALFVLLGLAIAAPAYAQMSEGEKKAAARASYMEGVELQDKGRPADALARFEAAQKLYDAPTHLLHIAECQALTGHLVEASETYETLARKQLPKDSPAAFVQAQEQAKAELAQLRPRIPSMRVTVKPEPASLQNLQIALNDKQMPNEVIGLSRPVNPGPYRISATAAGWSAAPVDTEVKEGEPKSVEITLRQGGAGVVGPVAPAGSATPGGTTNAPPPYEQPKKEEPKGGPSTTGFLFGIRPGVFVPNGDVTRAKKFERIATAGPGVGLDAIVRVARLFLVGGTLELAALGPPASGAIPAGQKVDGTTTNVYLGVLAGIMPNVDKVTFVADAGAGFRFLSRTETLTANGTAKKSEESYSGLALAINAGLSVPIGPIRIVPKAGLAFGTLSPTNCAGASGTSSLAGCAAGVDSATHTMFQLVLGLYYHLDTAKKPQG